MSALSPPVARLDRDATDGLPQGSVSGDPDIDDREAWLSNLIETEIVPRLLLVNQQARACQQVATAFTKAEIAQFGNMTLAAAGDDLYAYFRALHERGHSREKLFVKLLAPTAHYLGKLWEEDRCDFFDVTSAVSKLHSLIALFRPADTGTAIDPRHRALLVALPGEQHLLGLDIIAELLRSSGWEVVIDTEGDIARRASLVRGDYFGICGFTLSTSAGLPEVSQAIHAMRRSSCNRNLGVLVGGQAFVGHPEYGAQVGADEIVEDAASAVVLANKLLSNRRGINARAY